MTNPSLGSKTNGNSNVRLKILTHVHYTTGTTTVRRVNCGKSKNSGNK